MSTRVFLIEAAPTPWDIDGRLAGAGPLPLTAEGIDTIRRLVETLPNPVSSVYCPKKNEACKQAAQIVAKHFNIRLRDNPGLEAVNLGLWEGLTFEQVQFRFPTVFPKWIESPLTVTPPDGESLPAAIERIGQAVRLIIKRNRGFTAAIVIRPLTMQIAMGVLSGQAPQDIAGHLHQRQAIATIELPDS